MIIDKKNIGLWLLIFFILIAVLFFHFLFKKHYYNNEVDFCRKIVKMLIEGNQAVNKYIDWENFVAFSNNMGREYQRLKDRKTKSLFEKRFIAGFSLGFKYVQKQNGRKEFSHWRLYKDTGYNKIIAAEIDNRTVFFTLSFEKKLVKIDFGE